MWRTGRDLGVLLAATAAFAVSPAQARDLFTTIIDVPDLNDRVFEETNKLRRIPDLFSAAAIKDEVAGFDPLINDFNAVLDVRGLTSFLAWTAPDGVLGAGALTFSVPGVLSVEIESDNLDDALDELEDWFKGDLDTLQAPENLVTDFLQSLVKNSPVDPVAGNPNSLQSRMFFSDYRLGSEGPFTSSEGSLSPSTDLVGLGLEYGYAKGGSFNVNALDLPIDYRLNFKNPKWSMLFNLPLTATFTEGQWSVLLSLALGAQYRPFDWWSITPLVRFGGAGSIDVGALALMYSASVTNHWHTEWKGFIFGFSNLFGFTKTVDGIEISGIDISYELTNPLTTNGGYVAGAILPNLGWKFFGHNTQIWGDDLYMDSQSEVGLALEMLGSLGESSFARLSLSASYVFGNNDYDGLAIRLRGRF